MGNRLASLKLSQREREKKNQEQMQVGTTPSASLRGIAKSSAMPGTSTPMETGTTASQEVPRGPGRPPEPSGFIPSSTKQDKIGRAHV